MPYVSVQNDTVDLWVKNGDGRSVEGMASYNAAGDDFVKCLLTCISVAERLTKGFYNV